MWSYEPWWRQVAFNTAEDVTFHEENELNLQVSLQKQVLKAWQGFPTCLSQGLTMNDSRKSLGHIDFIPVNLDIY